MMKKLLLLIFTVAFFTVYCQNGGFRMIFNGSRTRLFQGKTELDFSACLQKQISMYPAMEVRDILKLVLQASFGSRHALRDKDAAYRYFCAEFDRAETDDGNLFEIISPDICRVNLRAWKGAGLPGKWLFNMFMASAELFSGGEDVLQENLAQTRKLISAEKYAAIQDLLAEVRSDFVHHSAGYRSHYAPSYRIVSTRFITALPVLLAAVKLPEKAVRVIAIDGRAASGKSTLARMLARIMDAGVVQMDDFFLPPELRTAERFAQAGGNVHYERFMTEVLPFLRDEKAFGYRIFDCKQLDYRGTKIVKKSACALWKGRTACIRYFKNMRI